MTSGHEATRLGLLIHPGLDDSIGENINGPSLIRVPDWVDNPLGRYYLYFAHHHGSRIRLAYADELRGPWTIFRPGVLQLADTSFDDHLASPDVHVSSDERRILMYYHGARRGQSAQVTRVATSTNGLDFQDGPEDLGDPYFRVFAWRGDWYALVNGGRILRSPHPLQPFRPGHLLFPPATRHSAVWRSDSRLHVWYSNAGDAPERILHSSVELTENWSEWKPSAPPTTILEPTESYEGAHLPIHPSSRGAAPGPVHQLRDPAIYEESGNLYLVYSVAGESGLALARITLPSSP
ncbi:hypothetical protein [Microlunatus speluncae]|uniref:hypothetical protein n=1 Tax=Microlunatus speluncae TaxID=2594267 RepID=UPI0012667E63|nr:hypothetical protein [Microlunatus speluncae]